jgi:SPP1 gp7 family putative phage head morphogenesis protein
MNIEDTLTRRQVFIQRFAQGRAREAEKTLARIYAKASERVAREPDSIGGQRLRLMLSDINSLLGEFFDDLSNDIADNALEFAEDEAALAVKAFDKSANVVMSNVSLGALEQAVFGRGMDAKVGSSKLTLNQALREFANGKRREILNIINDGILLGETTPEIAKQVKQAAKLRPKHQVNSLVRTAINHAGSMARKTALEENQAFFDGEEWKSTLDSRTTLICGGRDGNIYPLGEGPYPPAHWGCRSLRVPVFKEEFLLEKEKVKKDRTFDEWLRDQSADFQDEYFSQFPDGKEKAALFRRGGLDIQQFRTETGANYTLDDLRRIEPLAFSKANIE